MDKPPPDKSAGPRDRHMHAASVCVRLYFRVGVFASIRHALVSRHVGASIQFRQMDHDRLFKELISTFFVEFVELFLPDVARYMGRL